MGSSGSYRWRVPDIFIHSIGNSGLLLESHRFLPRFPALNTKSTNEFDWTSTWLLVRVLSRCARFGTWTQGGLVWQNESAQIWVGSARFVTRWSYTIRTHPTLQYWRQTSLQHVLLWSDLTFAVPHSNYSLVPIKSFSLPIRNYYTIKTKCQRRLKQGWQTQTCWARRLHHGKQQINLTYNWFYF